MKLTIELELSEEQADALTAYTVEWNGANGTSTNADRLTEDALMPFIAQKVEKAYQDAVRQMGEDARTLPYETRKALIAQVRAQIPD